MSDESDDGFALVQQTQMKRDDLMISLPIAYIIMALGVVGTLIQSLFAGFSIFMCACNYSWASGVTFLRYYSPISPRVGFAYCYICLLSSIIDGIYTLYAFLMIHKRYAQIMFLITLILSVITLFLSFLMLSMDQVFYAMEMRDPNWYEQTGNYPWYNNWFSTYLTPYKVEDIVRCILFSVQAILFVFAHQFSTQDFALGLDLTPM